MQKIVFYEDSIDGDGHYKVSLALPYRYSLAVGIMFVFIGIGSIALSKNI